MCENCRNRHELVMKQVNDEMDEQGVPEDSVLRGLADIQIACEFHLTLGFLMTEMYPTANTLLESPIDMSIYNFESNDE